MEYQEQKPGQRIMKLVLYHCENCGAFDCPMCFPNEQVSPAIVCANCHAGSGMKPEEQFSRKKGAFAIREQLIDLADLPSLAEARKAMQVAA